MDLASFISAIVSAAAGVYSVGMTGDRSIDIDLIFQPNQIVRVSASSTSTVLGTGSLTILRDSELTLARITVSADRGPSWRVADPGWRALRPGRLHDGG